jgi:hypothetical protein
MGIIIIIIAFIKHQTSMRNCPNDFKRTNLFNPHKNSMKRLLLLLFPFSGRINWNLHYLPKLTKPVSSWPRTQKQTISHNYTLNHHLSPRNYFILWLYLRKAAMAFCHQLCHI